jgi:hypothetical protein
MLGDGNNVLGYQPPNFYNSDDITTIFVVGFPDDMQEREFQNMFTFSAGFEAATLKVPHSCEDEKRQIIGFAKFRTRQEALDAKEILSGKRIDVEKGCLLKAEMAKKNLHTKKIGDNSCSFYNCAPKVESVFDMYRKPYMFPSFTFEEELLKEPVIYEPTSTELFSDNGICDFIDQESESEVIGMGKPVKSKFNPTIGTSVIDEIPSTASNASSTIQGLGPIFSGSASANSLSVINSVQSSGAATPHNNVNFGFESFLYQDLQSRFSSIDLNSFAKIAKKPTVLNNRNINHNNHIHPAPVLCDQNNAPCNTLYVGNLPPNACEDELRSLFSRCTGYKRLSFRNKPNGPMCFVEFDSINLASKALQEMYGTPLSNSTKGGIRLSFSKNPLGVRSNNNETAN